MNRFVSILYKEITSGKVWPDYTIHVTLGGSRILPYPPFLPCKRLKRLASWKKKKVVLLVIGESAAIIRWFGSYPL